MNKKYIKDIGEAEGMLGATTRFLVKTGVGVNCVVDCLIKVAIQLAYHHTKGDWKKWVKECNAAHLKRMDDADNDNAN